MRYGWEPLKTPVICPCGELFSVSHSLQCNKGGYTQMRHNEISDTFASVMKEACYDVEIDPNLQPLEDESFVHKTTTTEDEASVDIKANRLWDSRFCRTFSMSIFSTPSLEHVPKMSKRHINFMNLKKNSNTNPDSYMWKKATSTP